MAFNRRAARISWSRPHDQIGRCAGGVRFLRSADFLSQIFGEEAISAKGDASAHGQVAEWTLRWAVRVQSALHAAVRHGIAAWSGPAAGRVVFASGAHVRDADGTDGRASAAEAVLALTANRVVASRRRGGASGAARNRAAASAAQGGVGAVGGDAALDATVEGEVAARISWRRAVGVRHARNALACVAVQRWQSTIGIQRARC